MNAVIERNSATLPQAMEQALIAGDLSKLTEQERLSFYKATCESLGLNPLTKPFEYITLNGKLTLYARKDCTEQLRSNRGISLTITGREAHQDVYVVTARATVGNRTDESTGAVAISGLKGESLANAYMKAETKAKRRVTLSICGLGMLDESEIETIPGAVPAPVLSAPVAPASIGYNPKAVALQPTIPSPPAEESQELTPDPALHMVEGQVKAKGKLLITLHQEQPDWFAKVMKPSNRGKLSANDVHQIERFMEQLTKPKPLPGAVPLEEDAVPF